MDAQLRIHPFRPPPLGRRLAIGLTLVALLAAGCGGSSTHRELTQRERDSTLGRSVIPGAGTVTRALQESDRAGSAAHSLDAQVDSLSR